MFIKDHISLNDTRMVNCRVGIELHEEYTNLKKILRRHGFRVSLTEPFEEAIRKVNKEVKAKLKELNIDLH